MTFLSQLTALDFVAAAFIVLPMLFVIAACVYEIWRLATRKRGLKRIDAHAAGRRSRFRIGRSPFAAWRFFEHELPDRPLATATQMREAIGPSFGLGFEDDTEDDADVEVTATPKGEYL